MASPIRWIWVWASSRSLWCTGKPGMLPSMGSQKVGHDWVAELNWRREWQPSPVLAKRTMKVKSLCLVWLFATPETVAYQAPSSMGFSRWEYWSVLPFPSPGHLPDQGIEPGSPTLQADSLTSEPPGKTREPWMVWKGKKIGHRKVSSPDQKVYDMLLGKSRGHLL